MHTTRVRLVCLAALLIVAGLARADSGRDMQALFDLSLEELLQVPVSTGSRFGERRRVDAAVPVDVFDAAELRSQGSADLNAVLRNLLPAFNLPTHPISDGSSFQVPFTLRGLPPDQTLILINGKRRHRGAVLTLLSRSIARGAQGPDIAQLPLAAIKRIEVLRDGASAQYGSDAIAGVINIILDDDADRREAWLQTGGTRRGDGALHRAAGSVGFGRADAGFFRLTAEIVDQGETSRGTQREDAAYYASQGLPVADPAMVWGTPELRSQRALWNGEIAFAGDRSLYLFGNYSDTRHDGGFYYRNLGLGLFTHNLDTASGQLHPCPQIEGDRFGFATARNCLAIAEGEPALFNFQQWFPAGFAPRLQGRIEDLSQIVGVNGNWGRSGRFDLSAAYARNRIDYLIRNTINPSLGPESPQQFRPGATEQSERNLNADFTWVADATSIAVGAEWRQEVHAIESGDPASWAIGPFAALGIGSNGFPGFDPGQAGRFKRDNLALYSEIEYAFAPRLMAAAAIRHENFSDFGGTTNGKLSARFHASEHWTLRAAVSSGFRAPTPGQSHTTNVRTTVFGDDPTPVAIGLIPPTNPIAVYFGGKPLQAETSTNFTLGSGWRAGGLSLSADLFQIEVRDRIALSTATDITPELRQLLADAGIDRAGDFGRIQFFTNAFDSRTRGIDLAGSYALHSAYGNSLIRLAISRLQTRVTRIDDHEVVSPDRRINLERMTPRNRASLRLNHQWNRWQWSLTGNHYGSWRFALPDRTDHYGARTHIDTEIGYRPREGWELSLGLINLFDTQPGRNPTTQHVGLTFPEYSPSDMIGLGGYVRVVVMF
jgi:iron complex outermembrane recepter protein